MKDLIVLVADKNMEFLLRGLLPRIPVIEGIRNFNFEIIVHTYRDPGIFNQSHEFLRSFIDKFRYAIVILDFEGSGHENLTREQIETHIEENLSVAGWNSRSCAIAINPELENWIWVNEVRMQNAISWDSEIGLYDWLIQNGIKKADELKPKNPKEAFEAAIRTCNTPRSSSLYFEIAKSSSYKNCEDQAFLKMLNQIKLWFAFNE
jgi:hypothetical protein